MSDRIKIVPRVKTRASKVLAPKSKCADHWDKRIRIRAPHKGINKAYRELPSLGDKSLVESFDEAFLAEVAMDIDRVAFFVKQHADELTEKQKANATKMLERALEYLQDARTVRRGWSVGFTTPKGVVVDSYPLAAPRKKGVAPEIEQGRSRDQEKYKKLLVASLKNIRCAEEVAKKATVRLANAGGASGRLFAETFEAKAAEPPGLPGLESPTPTTSTPEAGTASFEEQEIFEGDIVLDESDEPSDELVLDESGSKKKKDNSLLIAGALAFGLLAAMRK